MIDHNYERPVNTTEADPLQTISEFASRNRIALHQQQKAEAIAGRLQRLRSDLGERYAKCSIGNFELSAERSIADRQRSNVDKLNNYSKDIVQRIKSGTGIAMIGTIGTGKDHLLAAMMILAAESGFTVQWKNGTSLIAEYRSAIDGNDREADITRPLVSCDVLAISDPAPPTGPLSPFGQERLLSIIDARYRRRRPVWFTLNATDPKEARDRISAQVFDRLTDGSLCLPFDWPSARAARRWTGDSTND